MKLEPEAVDDFSRRHRNGSLVEFKRRYAENGEVWKSWVVNALAEIDSGFLALDSALARLPWLSESHFGLADVAWMANVHRMWLMDWPLERYHRLPSWSTRFRSDRVSIVLSWRMNPAACALRSLNITRREERRNPLSGTVTC